ncbi:PREDICTED: odorant receptor 30a-like [Habropoda laboriosa]|uniref:odorant receptor 30a-like n=1 Tax=Habropoda laboriosa TaxID=597456 RepID=UPI00083D7445|nr:PREDICTED: odorant receptor 30a-like [Habropoda laboriosa]
MQATKYRDISLKCGIFLLKLVGLWMSMNSVEERRRRFTLFGSVFALSYGVYVNVNDILHSFDDLSHCIFLTCNTLCILLAIFKIFILSNHRTEFKEIVLYAQKHFWHDNYSKEERVLYGDCQRFCKLWVILICFLTQASLVFYFVTPLTANMSRNKSDRVLPFKMWVDWPLSDTPYYELMFTFQALCVYQIGAAYICSDTFFCMLNMHVICQFRILNYRLLNMWPVIDERTNMTEYTNKCYTKLIDCIKNHQSLIEFCVKLENVYTLTILGHIVVFSLLMCFDTYEVVLAKVPTTTRLIFLFHMIGSFIHIIFFTYSCGGLIEESMDIATATYAGMWTVLPMNKVGKMIRGNMKLMTVRSLQPCCITAGGFFPVSLKTATALMSSTMSYFTLMRERSAE